MSTTTSGMLKSREDFVRLFLLEFLCSQVMSETTGEKKSTLQRWPVANWILLFSIFWTDSNSKQNGRLRNLIVFFFSSGDISDMNEIEMKKSGRGKRFPGIILVRNIAVWLIGPWSVYDKQEIKPRKNQAKKKRIFPKCIQKSSSPATKTTNQPTSKSFARLATGYTHDSDDGRTVVCCLFDYLNNLNGMISFHWVISLTHYTMAHLLLLVVCLISSLLILNWIFLKMNNGLGILYKNEYTTNSLLYWFLVFWIRLKVISCSLWMNFYVHNLFLCARLWSFDWNLSGFLYSVVCFGMFVRNWDWFYIFWWKFCDFRGVLVGMSWLGSWYHNFCPGDAILERWKLRFL